MPLPDTGVAVSALPVATSPDAFDALGVQGGVTKKLSSTLLATQAELDAVAAAKSDTAHLHTGTYVGLTGAETVAGAKTFSNDARFNGTIGMGVAPGGTAFFIDNAAVDRAGMIVRGHAAQTGDYFRALSSGNVPIFGVSVDGVYCARPLGTDISFRAHLQTDAEVRWSALANGALLWGDGTLGPDVRLERSAANQLQLSDEFKIARGAVTAATQIPFDVGVTWSGTTQTFTAMKLNVTDTDSANGSKLIDLQVNAATVFSVDKDCFIQLGVAARLVAGTTYGLWIGTSTTQKLGFWNATPTVQPAAVANAAGGATVDTEARAALNALLSRLRTTGLLAT